MRLMGNPRPAWFLGHLSQIKRALDLGIGKRFGLIGKWERDAFIVRLQSVLQKNGQFGIPRLPSGEHISVTRLDDVLNVEIYQENSNLELYILLYFGKDLNNPEECLPLLRLVSTNFGKKK